MTVAELIDALEAYGGHLDDIIHHIYHTTGNPR